MTFNRKPVTPAGCFPADSQPPSAVADPCSILPELRAALYALLAGRQTAEVRNGNAWQRFHPGDVAFLKNEIVRLEKLCPRSATNPHGGTRGAVRVGPYSAGGIGHPAFNPNRYR